MRFLAAFQSLQYDNVPLGILLLRDFQKYALHHPRSFRSSKFAREGPIRNLHAACKPYLPPANPDLSKSGYTAVRAELFGVAKGSGEEKLLFVAHHRREYRYMAKLKECRPLVYLHGLPPAKLPPALTHATMRKLRECLAHRSTPAVFRQRAFRIWLAARVRLAILHIRRVHTLFDRYPIKQTIYGSTINHHGALITSFAQSRHVHTVNVQHGLFGPLGHLPINADLNFVWGKSHSDFLKSYGAPPDKIKISGPCFYRNLQTKHSSGSKSASARLQVLVALQPLGNRFNRTMIRRIERAARPYGRSVFVTYKLHPDQGSASFYRRLLSGRRSKIVRHGTIPLNRLINRSDIVLTPYSSVAYESLINGKPVFFYRRPRFVYYIRNAPIYFHTSTQLKRLLAKYIGNTKRLAAAHAKMGVIDSASSGTDGSRFIWSTLRLLQLGASGNIEGNRSPVTGFGAKEGEVPE